ncbi:MAG: peptidylprolyl isomerase [Pseudomonadales bacterium]
MRFVRDPLFVFIVIGILLFAVDSLRQRELTDRNIVVSKNDIQRLHDQWLSQMGTEPTPAELDGLIDSHVREEMFVREARKLGLEHGDVIIRRRLAQKLQFVVEDRALLEPPSDTALRGYFDRHQQRYQVAERLTFSHVFFSPERRDDATKDAAELLGSINDGNWRELGDSFMLRRTYTQATPTEIRRDFGSRFMTSLSLLPVGTWQGPVVSGYGQHLVKLTQRHPVRESTFHEAIDRVRNDFNLERRNEANATELNTMRENYRIRIER